MSQKPVYTLTFLLVIMTALPACSTEAEPPSTTAADDLAGAFDAAGFKQSPDGRWIRCEEEPPTLSYAPGRAEITDLNGDGNPEAWITEGSIFCYGNTGSAFVLLTRDDNSWRILLDKTGMHRLLDMQANGWPDIEVGGPGFSRHTVYRWNGHNYHQQP